MRFPFAEKKDPGEAYFGHHLDITIPYDELGDIEVQCADGRRILIFADGKFVLPGTEELNRFTQLRFAG